MSWFNDRGILRWDASVPFPEPEGHELVACGWGPETGRGEFKCGTHSGYTAHYRRGEKPCETCRDFKRAYARRKGKAA